MLTIGILRAGRVPPSLASEHGPYDAMMRRMLGDAYRYRTYDVEVGELPARSEDHDAYLVTGSPAGVYDALPWIEPLRAFLRAARGRARLLGICFGHQVLADAFGGRVEKSGKGWGLGLHGYEARGALPWMGEPPARLAVAAAHQDQVVEPPPGAEVLYGSAFTPYAMLGYGSDAISVQFHPEFSADFAGALVELKRAEFPGADAAIRSLEGESDAARVAALLRAFLDQPWAKAQ